MQCCVSAFIDVQLSLYESAVTDEGPSYGGQGLVGGSPAVLAMVARGW